jgi:hypothetical protein
MNRTRLTRRTWALSLTTAATLMLGACGGSDADAMLELKLSGLEDLGPTAVYEGWLMVNGAPVSTGRFSVDASGKPSVSRFSVPSAQADGASAFILTIEPAVGDKPEPADTHLMAGGFDAAKTTAALSIDHPAALGTNFAAATGRFILAAPSASTPSDDQGIWWLTMNAAGQAQPGLSLPVLPAGWLYEGWVVVGGKPISTGRFTSVSAADSDKGGPAAGPNATPPFPGQDFINPATKLPGGMAVISVEPAVDNSAGPFTLKPLLLPIGTAVGPANVYTMGNTLGDGAGLPKGTATLTR